MKFLKLTLASIVASSALFAGTYDVDSSHSNVEFKVKHLMISNVSGKFNNFNGKFEYDEKTKKLKSLEGNVNVSSINTDDEKRDAHLKSADFFDEINHPTLTFTLDKVDRNYAYGKLTIRGITKDIKLNLEDNGTAIDPWGNTRVALALSGKINRKDFGLNWNKALETGGVLVDETVKIDVEIQGILAK
ncbi:YceI family protein [Aliarcobacter lanthieri]|uniref:YceI family protein n=1 Tax=Aliarcobacter lanthieri TaxID=1355374 RepID=UPI003AB0AD02